jgi:hypothetical protein
MSSGCRIVQPAHQETTMNAPATAQTLAPARVE